MLFICIGNSSLFFSEKMFQVVLLMCGVFAFFFSPILEFRRLADALEIDDNSDPFNTRSAGPKYSDLLKEDARYVF